MRYTTEQLKEKETEDGMNPLTKSNGHFEAVSYYNFSSHTFCRAAVSLHITMSIMFSTYLLYNYSMQGMYTRYTDSV